ncbi:MAG: radical SAM protein [Nanoarchaeota archaeon]|nr:radical SAM protein [Nanoarchaeota archaeon]
MSEKLLKKTKSLCPKCLKELGAQVVEKNGRVYLKKKCDEHGSFMSPHILNYPPMYHLMEKLHRNRGKYYPEGMAVFVTRRCNQYCNFCFERAVDEKIKEPSLKEIEKKISGFKGKTVYLWGGEPTVRKDLPDVIQLIKSKGFRPALFSNGKKLADPAYVRQLKKAGLEYVILQFDSLQDKFYEKIRNEKLMDYKLKAVENLQEEGVYTGLFAMLVKGLNDREIGGLLDFCNKHDNIKTLFFSMVWEAGRLKKHKQIYYEEIFKKLGDKGIDFEVTKLSSVFAHNLFECLQKLGLQKGHKEPMCSTNTYLVRSAKGFVPLNHLVNLKRINKDLAEANKLLDEDKKIRALLPFTRGILRLFFSRKLFKLWLRSVKKNFANILRGRTANFMFLDVFSIVLGTLHTRYNIDLDCTRTCNLHSDIPGSDELKSTCIRQAMVEVEYENKLRKA